jgi:hypothetical protein
MNPYRRAVSAIAPVLGAARSARFRILARTTPLFAGALVFATGWALGRTTPVVPAPAPLPAPAEAPAEAPAACPPVAECPEKQDAPAAAGDTTPTRYAISSAQAKATIAVRARAAVAAIVRRDAQAFARFVDPDEGLTLGDLDQEHEVTLSAAEMSRCLSDGIDRVVGGGEIATCAELWKDHLALHLERASHFEYNVVSPGGGPSSPGNGTADSTLQAHPNAIVVQLVVRRPDQDSSPQRAWSTLRLVFEARGEEWWVRALAWSDWTTGHTEGCGG